MDTEKRTEKSEPKKLNAWAANMIAELKAKVAGKEKFDQSDGRKAERLARLVDILGSRHNRPVKKLPHQVEIWESSGGKWIHGPTNRGKTFCMFHLVEGVTSAKVFTWKTLEADRRGKITGEKQYIPGVHDVVAVDDIDNIVVTAHDNRNEWIQNELFGFFDDLDRVGDRVTLFITSNLSITEYCARYQSNRAGPLESRLRRMCPNEIDINKDPELEETNDNSATS